MWPQPLRPPCDELTRRPIGSEDRTHGHEGESGLATLPYWWVTRPHRKLIRIPKSLAAFAGVASGQEWAGNRQLQIDFETRLEQLDLKERGDHTERARGAGGSGGRTHAQLLYSLGLFFYHREDDSACEEVHLTLAGQALVDQEDALPIIRKQVLAYQFPSAYSTASSVNVDRKFKLRPFVLVLKLLRHPSLGGYITDKEIAACVIGDAVRHTDKEADRIAEQILNFRNYGASSLSANFAFRMKPPRASGGKTAEQLINSSLKDIANTLAQWIRYTGYAAPAPGEVYGASEKTVTALNASMIDEIDAVIEEWSSKPLLKMYEPEGDKFATQEASKAFQRSYGVKVGMVKDQRNIREIRGKSETDRTLGLVSASLTHLYATQIVTEPSSEVIDAVVNHSGLDRTSVASALSSLIASPAAGVNAFLDRYEQMAFSGQDEAINFEKATQQVLQRTFGLGSRHVGQGGTLPDVEVWSEDWGGIIDTKAYAAYDLPHDHQLRMHADYVPDYAGGVDGKPLEFFMYLSGGFAPSFNAKLRNVIDKASVAGSGIAIQPWRQLILGYPDSGLSHGDLLRMWSMGREVTSADVAEYLRGDRKAHV